MVRMEVGRWKIDIIKIILKLNNPVSSIQHPVFSIQNQ